MESRFRFELADEQSTLTFSRRLGECVAPGDVLLLEGPLGVGKTFLIAALVHALGVADDVAVCSPTFALIQEFMGRWPIVHADFYRLQSSDRLDEIGMDEDFFSDRLVLVEWGERFLAWFPRVTAVLRMSSSGLQRQVEWESRSARGEILALELRSKLPIAV